MNTEKTNTAWVEQAAVCATHLLEAEVKDRELKEFCAGLLNRSLVLFGRMYTSKKTQVMRPYVCLLGRCRGRIMSASSRWKDKPIPHTRRELIESIAALFVATQCFEQALEDVKQEK